MRGFVGHQDSVLSPVPAWGGSASRAYPLDWRAYHNTAYDVHSVWRNTLEHVRGFPPDARGDRSAVTDFRRDLLFLLHDVARLLRMDADRRARAHGMTRAQWGLLIWLERQPGLSQKELAELLEVEPITVARLIDRLEARGMVERRPDPRDRRIWRLHLCPQAYPVLQEIARQRAEIVRIVTAGIDPRAQEAMTEALIGMKAALAARRAEPDPADALAEEVA
jgi:MarR family transcriptional regulator, transcriptional regulator for hemolysin